LETILSICETLKEKGYNLYGLNAAAEYSLKGKRFDLTLSIFEKMRVNGVPIRAHYFWPIIINLFETEGVSGKSIIGKVPSLCCLESESF